MKKRKIIYEFLINKGFKKNIGIIIVLVIMGVGSIKVIESLQNGKKEISAHPTSKITLDENGTREFEIPTDASLLREQTLIDDPNFQDFVQGGGVVGALNKVNLESFSEQSGLYFEPAQRTSNGSWIFGISFRNDWYGENESWNGFQKYIVKADSDGNIQNVYNVANGATDFHTSNDTNLDGSYAVDGGGLIVDSGSVSMWYNGYSPTEKVGKVRRVSLDENLDPNTAIYTEGDFSAAPAPPTNSTRLYFRRDIVNDETWYTGNSDVPFGQEDSYEPTYNLLRLDNQTGAIHENITLRYPVLSTINSGVTNITKGIVGIQGSRVTRASDNGFILHAWIYHKLTDTWQIAPSEHIIKFDSAGEFQWSKDLESGTFRLQDNLSNATDLVVLEKTNTSNRLISINTSTGTETALRNFPIGTDISIIRNPNVIYNSEFDFYGSVENMQDDFSGYVNGPGVVMGTLDNNYSVNSANFINADAAVTVEELIAINGTDDYFIYGYTNSRTFSNEPPDGWQTHLPNVSNKDLYFGSVKKEEDFAPAIAPKNDLSRDISINIDDPDIKKNELNAYGWTVLDNWLITGKKNGNITDQLSIKVHDNVDSQNASIAPTPLERQEWLEKRINRNPRDVAADIEWIKLGFNINTTGPQLVTYFITDSQNQPAVTSRWVNKKSEETIVDEDDKYALDAQNFHIPLTGIDTSIPNEDKFKELAKTMAWSLTKHESADGDQGNGLDEDGTDSSKLSAKVTVDANQLKTLREATVAKPYPVDVTYKPENGIEIKNRVWVFVTTKNTIPNSESNPKVTPVDTNGVVYYADDYSLPFRLRSGHTAADVLDRGNVRVYDYYDSTHETDAELPVLADKTTNSAKLQVVNLNAIKSATQPGLIDSSPPDGSAMIRYEWDGTVDGNHQVGTTKPTLGGLDVTLTGDILLHVRQVIVGDSNQLVVPEKGYLRMATNDYDGVSGTTIENADQLRQVRISSGKNADNPGFETIAVNADHMDDPLDELELKLIIPEYYEIVGNYLTLGSADANGASHAGKTEADKNRNSLIFQRDDLYNDEEYFITIYLKPKLNQDGPQPYSWDYKKNDLGKIKTK